MPENREWASRFFIPYAIAVMTSGLLALVLALRSVPVGFSVGVGVLLLSAVLAEYFALKVAGLSVSLAFLLVVAAAITGGPGLAGLVAAATFTNWEEIRSRRPIEILLFNLGQTCLAGVVCGLVYMGVGAPVLLSASGNLVPLQNESVPVAILGAFGGGLAYASLNMGLTAIAIRLGRGVGVWRTVSTMLPYWPTQFALLFVGILIAQVLATSILALPLFLFPLLLARQVYQRYTGMQEAYIDTVKSLIGALEAKDPYTRGHSERVAGYAVALGELVGYDERSLETLEKAALLHDIGKLGLSSALLAKPSRLTDEEFAAILKHPGDGAGMIDRIRPLRGLVEYVRYHHEKFDGTGYPSKIAGTDIPQFSRVLAVADAFDAMTTNRAYRAAMSHEDAVDELLRCAGTQFDPELVEAFVSGRLGVPAPPDGAEYHDSAQEVGASSQ